MADGLHVELKDGARIKAGLRVAPKAMKKELRRSNVVLARQARAWTRAAAASDTGQRRHMAGGIGSGSTSTSAFLAIRNTKGAPGALGAFYGSKQYRQFPKWVGNSWPVGHRTRGPQPINAVLMAKEPVINDLYLDGQMSAVARAFPRGTK